MQMVKSKEQKEKSRGQRVKGKETKIAFCFLPFAFIPIAICFSFLAFSPLLFSQNVDSINIILKSTSDANEKVVLLNDYSSRRITSNQLNSAKKSAERAFEIAQKAEFNFGKATALGLLGEIESNQNNFSSAFTHFKASEQIFLKDGDNTDCSQLYLIWAKSALMYKKPDDAIKYATYALNFYAFNSNTPLFESELHKIIGESWLQKNNESHALNEFDESLKLLVENSAPDSVKSKRAFEIGQILFEAKNYDDALANFNASLSIELIHNNSERIAFDRFNIAKCHFKLHELGAASTNAEKSLRFFENAKDTLNTILSNLLLAEISLKDKVKAKSVNYLKKAESLISPMPINSANAYALNEIARIYGKLGDTQKQHQYLLKYTSVIDTVSQKNGDIFTVDSGVEMPKLTFFQKLKSKIDSKLLIFLAGLLSVLTTVFLFSGSKKQKLDQTLDSEKILQSPLEPIEIENPSPIMNNNFINSREIVLSELSNSDLIKDTIQPIEKEILPPKTQLTRNKELEEAFIESSLKLNKEGLLDTPANIFKLDRGFIVNTKQQKEIDALLENVFQAALINFEKPISFLKFSTSDIEPNSFILKTIIGLPKNGVKEDFFKAQFVSNIFSDTSLSEFNYYINSFKKQLELTQSKAIFANIGSSNYLILFTEIFDVAE